MAEYIDKHEAYLLLKDLEAAYIYPPVKEAYATAARRIDQKKAADVQPINRWISIEESKPEDMQQVLAVVDGDTREAFYNAGCFIGSNFYRSINEVKWWQPLPEPPKGR